jgi:hydroxymethylpyrimidine pyrophosphatase-like HAD family hydrolase
MIESLARYIATRAQKMRLNSDPTPEVAHEGRHKGLDLLTNSLCRAFSSRVARSVMRIKLQEELSSQNNFAPVMTDSKMTIEKWLRAGNKLLKSDFEHHCFGKNELSITDPAFDLASAIFHFQLSEAEASQLIRTYIKDSGDRNLNERLFFNKMLVGIQAQFAANFGLQHPKLALQRDTFNRQYISAWNFLVQETVSECAKLCYRPPDIRWHAPLAVLDIDGVMDRMVFGFPSTTAAGIKAISLLHSHGCAVALNTARTLDEVKHYCRAYGFAGGVAEYGGVLWDSITDRELVLVSDESREQLAMVREAIRKIPGCFLNDDYQYSLRAFTYQSDRTAPLPALLVQDLLASLHIDRLKIHQTGLDTAIVAKETDKGVGLRSLLSFVNLTDRDVIAVGDSEPDLAMFRVAGRSFAPGNVTCGANARLLGCHIAGRPCQPGLLEIVRQIVHSNGDSCSHCETLEKAWPKHKSLFVSLLEAADEKPLPLLLRNLLSPSLLGVLRKK